MHAQLVFLSSMRREAVEAECAAVFDKFDGRVGVGFAFRFTREEEFFRRVPFGMKYSADSPNPSASEPPLHRFFGRFFLGTWSDNRDAWQG